MGSTSEGSHDFSCYTIHNNLLFFFFLRGGGQIQRRNRNEQNVRNAQAFNNFKSILLAKIKLKDYLASHLFHSFLFLVKCQGQEEAPFHNVDHSSDRNKWQLSLNYCLFFYMGEGERRKSKRDDSRKKLEKSNI